jgi:hypothetical protein
MEAFQSTEEAVYDGSCVQQIRRRGKPMRGRVLGRRCGFRGRFTRDLEVRPGRRDQRFRSVGQDEVQLKNSAPMSVAPDGQRLAFERVQGPEDGDL